MNRWSLIAVCFAALIAGFVTLGDAGRAEAQWPVAYTQGYYNSGFYYPGYAATMPSYYAAYRSGYWPPTAYPYAANYYYRPFYANPSPARAWVQEMPMPMGQVYGSSCGCGQ